MARQAATFSCFGEGKGSGGGTVCGHEVFVIFVLLHDKNRWTLTYDTVGGICSHSVSRLETVGLECGDDICDQSVKIGIRNGSVGWGRILRGIERFSYGKAIRCARQESGWKGQLY